MKKILLLAGILSSCFHMNAQTDELKWNVGFYGGLTQYNGDRGQNFYKFDQAAYGFASISFSRYLSKHFDLTLFATRGEVGTMQKLSSWSTPNDIANRHFLTRMNTVNLAFRYNITGPQ